MKTTNIEESPQLIIDGGDKHHDPFVVPDGYFETLTQRTMGKIDAIEGRRKKHTTIVHLWQYSAAACIVLVAGVALWLHSPQPEATVTPQEVWEGSEMFAMTFDEWDEALDYAMIDNDDIAYYLTEL